MSTARYEDSEPRITQDDRDRSFMARGACRGMPPGLFFPERGGDVRTPKLVCAGCEVRPACAEYGMGEPVGIFGGLSGHERRRRRARARRAA